MVSGALLLPKATNMGFFFRQRFGKVAWPTLFWSLFYLADLYLRGYLPPQEAFRHLLSIPFSPQGNGVLWFMYTLMGLYLITPILSAWLQNATKREVEGILLIWGVTLLYPFLKNILSTCETRESITYYMSGYVGYYLLGYYLNQYVERVKVICLVSLMVIPLSAAVIVKWKHWNVDFYQLFWYHSIFVAMMSAFWFLALKGVIRIPMGKMMERMSNYVFGVYLVHIFWMRRVVWQWDWLTQQEGLVQITFTVALTLLLSLATTYLISCLPFSKYIIGYKK
jgi:surface polysaccharide O-acyltransferase-like enzyme